METKERYGYAYPNVLTKALLYSAAVAAHLQPDEDWQAGESCLLVRHQVRAEEHDGWTWSELRPFNSLTNLEDASLLATKLHISTEYVNARSGSVDIKVSMCNVHGDRIYTVHQNGEGLTAIQTYCKAVTEAAAWYYRLPMKDYTRE